MSLLTPAAARSAAVAALVALASASLAPMASAASHEAAGEGAGSDAASMAHADVPGAAAYRQNCASCHGREGRGDGPVAEFLKVDVPDLTTIAARNDGAFPFVRMFHIVDGRQTLRAHGTEMMPVWGEVYRREVGGDAQPINRMATETTVRGRVLELVSFLTAIQEPPLEEGSLLQVRQPE